MAKRALALAIPSQKYIRFKRCAQCGLLLLVGCILSGWSTHSDKLNAAYQRIVHQGNEAGNYLQTYTDYVETYYANNGTYPNVYDTLDNAAFTDYVDINGSHGGIGLAFKNTSEVEPTLRGKAFTFTPVVVNNLITDWSCTSSGITFAAMGATLNVAKELPYPLNKC